MNGFLTLLTSALAILILALIVFLMGGGSYAESPDSIAPSVTEHGKAQADPLPALSVAGSDTCQEYGAPSEGKLDSKLTGGAAASVVTGEPEAEGSEATDILKDLKLSDGLSLKISGTGETCN